MSEPQDMGQEAFQRLVDVLQGVSLSDLKKILTQTALEINYRMPGCDQNNFVGAVWPEGAPIMVCFGAGAAYKPMAAAYAKVKVGFTGGWR